MLQAKRTWELPASSAQEPAKYSVVHYFVRGLWSASAGRAGGLSSTDCTGTVTPKRSEACVIEAEPGRALLSKDAAKREKTHAINIAKHQRHWREDKKGYRAKCAEKGWCYEEPRRVYHPWTDYLAQVPDAEFPPVEYELTDQALGDEDLGGPQAQDGG